MRGKLRDKHANFNQEELEQRRPYKRDSRTILWSNAQDEEEELMSEDDEKMTPNVELPKKSEARSTSI